MLKCVRLLLTVSLLFGFSKLFAQDEIASDRPAYTWSSSTLKNKQIQIQSGINLFRFTQSVGIQNPLVTSWNIENVVRFGLPKKLEADIAFTQSFLNKNIIKVSQFSGCIRYQISENENLIPQSTVIYKVDYYLATKLLPSAAGHSLHYSASWKVAEKVGFASANSIDLKTMLWIGSTLNLSYSLAGGWGLVGEAFLQPNKLTFYNLAVTYKPKPNLMFDLFGGPQYRGDTYTTFALQGGLSWLLEPKSKTTK